MSKVFLDTNILIYSLDQSDSRKRNKSRELIRGLTVGNNAVISTQVMQEFYVAATGRLGADPLLIKDILRSLEHIETVVVTPTLIKEAIDCAIIHRLSFWDALIVTCADSAQCETLWTEDLNHGQIIRSVRIENPFKR
ncbi:MAG: PIN domain-containing protein [Desulfatitalea sp.]